MSKVYWKQRNGVLISVDDMDINHLRNTLKMIIRNSQTKVRKSEPFLKGDMANTFNDDIDLADLEAEFNIDSY